MDKKSNLDEENKSLKIKINNLKKINLNLNNELKDTDDLDFKLKELKNENDRLNNDLINSVSCSLYHQLEDNNKNLKEENKVLNMKIKESMLKDNDNEKTNKLILDDYEKLKKKYDYLKIENVQLKIKNSNYENDLIDLKSAFNQLNEKNLNFKDLEDIIDNLKKENKEIKFNLNHFQNKSVSVNSYDDQMKESNTTCNDFLTELIDNLDRINDIDKLIYLKNQLVFFVNDLKSKIELKFSTINLLQLEILELKKNNKILESECINKLKKNLKLKTKLTIQ